MVSRSLKFYQRGLNRRRRMFKDESLKESIRKIRIKRKHDLLLAGVSGLS